MSAPNGPKGSEVLGMIERAGVQARLNADGMIELRPRMRVSDEIIAAVRDNRAAVVAALVARDRMEDEDEDVARVPDGPYPAGPVSYWDESTGTWETPRAWLFRRLWADSKAAEAARRAAAASAPAPAPPPALPRQEKLTA